MGLALNAIAAKAIGLHAAKSFEAVEGQST
jgi:hypothetical protein